MIRGFGAEREQFLLDLSRMQERAQRAQAQITSGFRISSPSDAPAEIVRVIDLQTQLARAVQTQTNFGRLASEVNANEAVLRNAVKIVEEVRVAGARGADSLVSESERKVLAERVRSWHAELVRVANFSHSGRYQFSGDLDGQSPYTSDWTQPGGVVRTHNAPDTRLLEDFTGNRFSVSRRAQDIFDLRDSSDTALPGNVFHAVHELALALEANDESAIDNALALIDPAAEHLNQELMFFGNSQNRVGQALEEAKKAELRLTADLSDIRDADVTAAVLELQQATIGLQAALGAQGLSRRMTLFDYLG